ncbi:sulfatase-like hydrolase/transferase, partial [Paenibacillus sp. 598K]|uniref:sulfatase-like hydrolase/transferase n=1 Tax=Paenibacillus sp. 598K TaxID=1117987 RepID=UPI0011CF0228
MQHPSTKPNILWISLEDVSPRFGCYGDSLARTPHIDKLAEQGTLYRQAFATAAV